MLVGLTSAPTLQTTISHAEPSAPQRLGRLRGLSYLRNYTSTNNNGNTSTTTLSGPDQATGEGAISESRAPPQQKARRVASAATITAPRESPTATSHDGVLSPPFRLSARGRDRYSAASRASLGTYPARTQGPTAERSRLDGLVLPRPLTGGRMRRTFNRSTDEPMSTMTRHRSVTTPNSTFLPILPAETAVPQNPPSSRRISAGMMASTPAQSSTPTQLPVSQLPSIRLVPYQDPRTPRPSLNFHTVTRTLPNTKSIIRVGRYSEKDSGALSSLNDQISDAPVGFKSKVVSRRHCEFFYENNQWYIKDVKSSSGTFLNHVRLSGPGTESKPFAIKDGDLVQLGIDFKGGEETIFRCVKIRILCNRGWQKSINKFKYGFTTSAVKYRQMLTDVSKSAHKQLNDLQKSVSKGNETGFQSSTECTICLNPVAPCQSLFVAPCSHTWHYKCIRPMLDEVKRGSNQTESLFTCPNCRNVADLDADVDEAATWDQSSEEGSNDEVEESGADVDMTHIDGEQTRNISSNNGDSALAADMTRLGLEDTSRPVTPPMDHPTEIPCPGAPALYVPKRSPRASGKRPKLHIGNLRPAFPAAASSGLQEPSATPGSSSERGHSRDESLSAVTPFTADQAIEGLMTPRNAAGPFVLDGGAGEAPDGQVSFFSLQGASGAQGNEIEEELSSVFQRLARDNNES